MRRAVVLLCIICRFSTEMESAHLITVRKTSVASKPKTVHVGGEHPVVAVLRNEDAQRKTSYIEETKDSVEDGPSQKSTSKMEKNIQPVSTQSSTLQNIIAPKAEELEHKQNSFNTTDNLKYAASNMIPNYDKDFHVDEDDARSDTKSSYYVWPFFYHSPYEYVPIKIDVENEKAKDKRFVLPNLEKVIPVHENVKKYFHDTNMHVINYLRRPETVTTDNPIFGNQPFFSYILNDYFDKTDDDDPLEFRGLSWGREFDHEMSVHDKDDYATRIRRLESKYPNHRNEKYTDKFLEQDMFLDIMNSKSYDSALESDSDEKDDENKYYNRRYKYNGENYKGFKNFADSFAKRFGADDPKRSFKSAQKNKPGKRDKKDGSLKIYQKDEYQDFFDNLDNSENFEDKNTLKVRIGGSEFSRSQAAAALGNTINHIPNEDGRNLKDSDKVKDRYDGIQFHQYRNVAKNTALSNNADYIDRYTM